ncbi:MAG TPA: AMP-dependent synthetase/ligase [Solirubrobacteraceae bacterium]|nr:AMP-dependent synthetase/ligase [Solirubrobacteraceae bacterium]
MESSTAVPIHERATGSATIADLIGLAAERHRDNPAIRHKRDGVWHDVSYAELGETVSEVGRGLIDLGIVPGDRVAILCSTRPEWTYADFGIATTGAVVVPIYPTNSPEECQWVAGNSESVAIVCEDAAQVAKIRQVRGDLPALETIIVIDPSGEVSDAIPLDAVRERGRGRDAAELEQRAAAVTRDQPYTIIYTSGTTGPPKGCVLSHGNYRDVVSMCERDAIVQAGDVAYLFLPLAHSFALLIQLTALDLGATLAYFGGDPKQIVAELSEVRPTYLPSVPRIFEKLYTLVTAHGDLEQIKAATQVGLKVRALQAAGQEVPAELQAHFDAAEEQLFKNVRAAFGGQLRQATSGAAPIAKEILEFFFACGVPVLEGYGMTETATASTVSTVNSYRFGSVGRALPGMEVRIADDGEVLLKGPNIFQGYYRNDDASFGSIVDGWLHTGDLGRLDDDGFLFITGRKKDIIITAGGKNLTPANLENDLKQSRWISQAVMHGDRRPYPVALITLDPEEIVHFAREHGLPEDIAALSKEPRVIELIQGELDKANERYAQVEKIKKFVLLDHDLSQETGELTPTLKVKRNVVSEKYADLFDSLYAG